MTTTQATDRTQTPRPTTAERAPWHTRRKRNASDAAQDRWYAEERRAAIARADADDRRTTVAPDGRTLVAVAGADERPVWVPRSHHGHRTAPWVCGWIRCGVCDREIDPVGPAPLACSADVSVRVTDHHGATTDVITVSVTADDALLIAGAIAGAVHTAMRDIAPDGRRR